MTPLDAPAAATAWRSPFAGLEDRFAAPQGARASLSPISPCTLINLRGHLTDGGFENAIANAFGIAPPATPNRWVGRGDRAALWLGPDEWLLMAEPGVADQIDQAIRTARPDDPWLSVVDVSHNYSGLRLDGPAAREVLAGGCALDLAEAAMSADAVVQTLLAKARVILRRDGTPDGFEVWVRNSFARYMAAWLFDGIEIESVANTI
jgi:sarcosine oxidase subunit gamma